MPDGFKINCQLNDFLSWKDLIGIEFEVPIGLNSGSISSKTRQINGHMVTTTDYKGRFELYTLCVKETLTKSINDHEGQKRYRLFVNGSFPTNYFNGHNYSPFQWDHLQSEIYKLQSVLHLNLADCKLDNLEVGVNLPVSFSPIQYLEEELIGYKTKTFDRYQPKNGESIGFLLKGSQSIVKLYDKGLQFNLPDYLMRFELRFFKMEGLNKRGIYHLGHLMNRDKVKSLGHLLTKSWKNVLLYDSSINLNQPGLKERERKLILTGNNPRYWSAIKKTDGRAYYHRRSKFKALIDQYGNRRHRELGELIKSEWENQFM